MADDLSYGIAAIRTREELDRTQELVVRSEKLSSIGTLTAGAAHEILNPTNIIGMHAQRMLRQHDELSREYKSAEVIYRNVERINHICDDLRRFSREEESQFAPFDPDETVQESINLVLHELRLASIRHNLQISGDNLRVLGDHNQIQQVFFNLIGNAKDAMPSGGDLFITTKEVIEDEKRWWECRVKDTGAGIPREILPRLFDPFFTTKPEDKGTGLGLSVTYGIIESHGGKIWAESDGENGSAFYVRLLVDEGP
jgi:signal transduction histidine kinase